MQEQDIPRESALNDQRKANAEAIREAQERQELAEQEPVRIDFASMTRNDYILIGVIVIVYMVTFLLMGWAVFNSLLVAVVMGGFPVFLARGKPSPILLYLIAGVGIFALVMSIIN